MWAFTPEAKDNAIAAPWFEDARADFAPYYSSTKNIKSAMSEVAEEMVKLGAFITSFQPGKFTVNKRTRLGYVIEFMLNGAMGRIQIAGLPMFSPTEPKEKRVRVQCLLNVKDWLKAAVTMQVFSPDTSPLIPYLLVSGADGHQYTVADLVMRRGEVPMLAAPTISVEQA